MSGPKVSVYSLMGWARRVVDGQIRCEQQALVCGEQIKSILASCSGMGGELEKALAMLELLQRRCGGQDAAIEEVKALQNNLAQEIAKIQGEFSKNIPTISPKYWISEEALKNMILKRSWL